MLANIKLLSNSKNEINNFLNNFYNSNLELENKNIWEIKFANPIELANIIGVYIDNLDNLNITMLLMLDPDVYINITEHNGNYILKYLYERFPY